MGRKPLTLCGLRTSLLLNLLRIGLLLPSTNERKQKYLPLNLARGLGLDNWLTSNDSNRLHCKKNFIREHDIASFIKVFFTLSPYSEAPFHRRLCFNHIYYTKQTFYYTNMN